MMLFLKHLHTAEGVFYFLIINIKGCGMDMGSSLEPDSESFCLISNENTNNARNPFSHFTHNELD